MKLRQLERSEQGFALIAAIVLIVILAAMAGFVATMVGGQSAGQQLERMSGVADRAAQTGVEWGAYQVLRQSPGVCPFVPAVQPLSVPGTPVGMTVVVSCAPGAVPATYQITATAIFDAPASPAGPNYVERIKTAVFP